MQTRKSRNARRAGLSRRWLALAPHRPMRFWAGVAKEMKAKRVRSTDTIRIKQIIARHGGGSRRTT